MQESHPRQDFEKRPDPQQNEEKNDAGDERCQLRHPAYCLLDQWTRQRRWERHAREKWAENVPRALQTIGTVEKQKYLGLASLFTIASSSWLKSISYFNFWPKISAMETVTEYETKAIAKQSTRISFQRSNFGTTACGKPTGMWPTGIICHVSSIFRNFESSTPPITIINSIGIGTLVRFATTGFKSSLLNINSVIVIIDSRMATWLATEIELKISMYVWNRKTQLKACRCEI